MSTGTTKRIFTACTKYGKSNITATQPQKLHLQRNFANPAISISTPCMEVRESPNKGLGAFATKDIAPFTRLLSDVALISLGPSEDLPQAFEQYQSLPPEQRAGYLKYHAFQKPERDTVLAKKLFERGIPSSVIPEMVQVSSIFTSNAFNVEDGSGNSTLRRAMFPMISRLNHSCVPNSHTNYDSESGTMSLFAITNIPSGQEIEISYFNLLLPKDLRQAKAVKWGFSCTCPACESGEPGKANQFETRRDEIRNIEQHLAGAMSKEIATTSDLQNCILKAQDMVTLVLDEDSLRPQLPIAYDYVATFQTVALQVTKDVSLKDPILANLDSAIAAEADITGTRSPATENRRRKKEAISQLITHLT